jgi:ribosome-associated protein
MSRKPSRETEESTSSLSSTETSSDPSRVKALLAAKAVLEKKAENVKILDISDVSGFTDYFVICSGMSDRQVVAIAESVEFLAHSSGIEIYAVEGRSEGRWVLMDLGDVVVHVFLDALREYYDLEALWSDAPRVASPASYYGTGGSPVN